MVLVAEEALDAVAFRMLRDHIPGQPAWSDLPVIVLTRDGAMRDFTSDFLGVDANVSFLARPAPIRSVLSAVRVGARSRMRQYQMRDLLAQLEETDRRKDEFMAMLGHELRNPLGAIRTGVTLLEDAQDESIRPTVEVLGRPSLLRSWGHRVWEHERGTEGIRAIDAHRPDVALVDIGLPDTDGYELARGVRERHGHAIRLIAVTGYGQHSDRIRAWEAGFDDHLVKPVAPDDLRRALRGGGEGA